MKYDKIVGLKKQQEKENLEIIQREIDAMLRRKERISITTLAKYAGVDRSYFYRNLQAKQMVEDAQLKQGECYNPKKAIFDRATEEVNKQLKRQMILYKRRIKELELQIDCLLYTSPTKTKEDRNMAKPYKIPDFRKMYPEASEEVIAVLRTSEMCIRDSP